MIDRRCRDVATRRCRVITIAALVLGSVVSASAAKDLKEISKELQNRYQGKFVRVLVRGVHCSVARDSTDDRPFITDAHYAGKAPDKPWR